MVILPQTRPSATGPLNVETAARRCRLGRSSGEVSGTSPPREVMGLLGLIRTQGHPRAWPVDRVRQFGDRTEAPTMPIDPSMLAKSIGTLTDLDPNGTWPPPCQAVVRR